MARTRESLERRLDEERKSLSLIEMQIAKYTDLEAPIHLLKQRDDAKERITKIEGQLCHIPSEPPPPAPPPVPLLPIAGCVTAVVVIAGALIVLSILLVGRFPTLDRYLAWLRPSTPTPTPTKTSVIVLSPTTTDTPTLTPLPSPTPTPTPYYVEIVVDASERMSAEFESGTTKIESAWQTASTIASIRAQQRQFVTVRLFGGRDGPGGGSCKTSYPLFDFTNDGQQIMNYLAQPPTPGGEAAVVRALLDAAQELNAHENIGREIILLTGGDDGCNVALSAFYNSSNRSLWTQTFVVLFSDENLGPFTALETQGANIYYDLVRNRAEAEAVAKKVADSPPPEPTPIAMVPTPTSPPPPPTTGGGPPPTSMKPPPLTPTGGTVTATRPPTPIVSQSPTPTSTPTNTPTSTKTAVPPTNTPTTPPPNTPTPTKSPTPTQAPTSEVTYDPGSRTITVHPGNAQAQTGRLCKGKMADVDRWAVFLRSAYLQAFGEPAGLRATITHVQPEKSINVALYDVEVGQYNDTEIDANGEQLDYRKCAFNLTEGMRSQLQLPVDLKDFNAPERFDHGTITIQLSSTPVGFILKDKPVEPGIFTTSGWANMGSRATTFRQFYWETAAINGTTFSPGSNDGTSYRIAYDRVNANYYAGWDIILPETDVTGFSKLAFDIKGQVGGERPNVWLASPGGSPEGVRNFVGIENYVTVPTNWQRVEIPLTHFHVQGGSQQTIDLTRIIRVQIVFEWEDMAGMVYVDGFAFE